MFVPTAVVALFVLTQGHLVSAVGSARVLNNCGIPVYMASVAQYMDAPMVPLPVEGYSEPYSRPDVGVSIKLAPNVTGPVTQFEFTWSNGTVAYDISNIDGNPFMAQGAALAPSMAGASGYPTCEIVSCPAGQVTCDQAYNAPDDVRTKVCPEDSDVTFTLCPGRSTRRHLLAHNRVRHMRPYTLQRV